MNKFILETKFKDELFIIRDGDICFISDHHPADDINETFQNFISVTRINWEEIGTDSIMNLYETPISLFSYYEYLYLTVLRKYIFHNIKSFDKIEKYLYKDIKKSY